MPQPADDSERLLFRNLFDTLIRLDCTERVRAGLAETWVADSGGAIWTFTLRQGATLRSGSPVSGVQVATTIARAQSGGWIPRIDSVQTLSQRQLRFFLSHTTDSVPHLFADPALAVTDDPVPVRPRGDGNIRLPAIAGTPLIEFRVVTGDPRDALDRGADLLVTRSPALTEYAASRLEFVTFTLPWSRTYVLVQPGATELLEPMTTVRERQSLARDAVQADARAAEPLGWLSEASGCPATNAAPASAAFSRVAYIRGDDVARGLAERLVALASPGTGLRTVALEPPEFARLLRAGAEWAYVVSVPRQTLAPCRELADLPQGARILPLIDTRAHAIVRKGAPPLTVDWDGTLRVAAP